jgi:DNA mismatch endonuclease (patch repair protein)
MTDIWSKEKRSVVMSKIRSKNTKPEIMLRSFLHGRGFRFRIHRKELPGKPDIVLSKYKATVFVHGCFWHFHADCREGRVPDTNSKFWQDKLSKNVARDQSHQKKLTEMGWRVIIIWECELEAAVKNNGMDMLLKRIIEPSSPE